ncbi:MAG: penicillin acylase family protein [Longimicrobiales bacterium]
MIRKVFKAAVVVVALAAMVGIFTVRHLRSGPEILSETLTLEGLAGPVDILYDSMGVPHLFAASLEDLFLAQGYVHATHRLWQMEMFRRVLQGRLSEIFGAATIETDRFLRTIGLEEAAQAGTPSPDSPVYRHMDRYAQGVNAAIDGWRGFLPPEFVLLRFTPEPWNPVLTQGIEKIMAWDLSDYQTGLNLAAAREALGDSALKPLMPSYPEWGVTIVDGWPRDPESNAAAWASSEAGSGPAAGSASDAGPGPPAPAAGSFPPLPPAPDPELLAQATLTGSVVRVLELGSAARASNSWVVGGARSRSGKPLLANDMHLALNAPNIWFLVGLHAPGFDAVGMSLPGAPGIVVGHTKALAWGYTNAMVDDSDFFIERVNPEQPEEYLTPDGWAPFQVREEVIRVKGRDPVALMVRSTHHGPVITPVEERAGDRVLAFQWVAHAPARTFEALIGMAQAQNVGEFLQAMRGFDNPHQNVVFADTAGAWGYWMGGRVPLRASGLPPQLPVPGWTGEHDWVGWVPFEEKPHVLAPERGYIATANNAQGRDERARWVTDGGWFGPYRAQRISELLEARDFHDSGSLLAIQMDPGSAFVDRYLGYAVEAFRAAGLEELSRRLEGWDRQADLESTEATLFHSWWTELRTRLREHYYGGSADDGPAGYFPDRVAESALQGELELPSGMGEDAARSASEFADLPWGEAHQLTLDHPLSMVPVVGRLLRFGRSGIPRVGGPNSVNVGHFSGSHPPFRSAYGPSQRHVVDLADPDGSGGFILPGGQSGYPDNAHSFDQLELWRDDRLWLLPLGRSEVESRAVAVVRLNPGRR